MSSERAAQALGVATLHDLADYHRLRVAEARAATRELEASGMLVPVTVEGWTSRSGAPSPAWMHHDARLPRALAPDAILTPFDPLVWFRPRAERLFHFHYRLEIYTPKNQRQYGYYSLPLLVAGKLAGRMDLKAERGTGVLRVQSAWQEPGAPTRTPETAVRLLAQAAAWQGLPEVRTSGVGNLALPQAFAAAVSPGR